MPMLSDPSTKYVPYRSCPFPAGYVRQWPQRRTATPPTWLSTDLRDGNQALINPMSNQTKLEFFRLLVKIGFKEIEVAYPSASEQEFNFVRTLIENNEVPDDVHLQVITPARADLIEKSIASLAGCKNAIIHLYNAVSPVFREVVFRNTPEKTIDLTLNAVRLVKKLTEEETARSGTRFRLNYCLETFSETEPEFAVQLANKVLETWGKAGPGDDKVILNLPATVEIAPCNHYADMVEFFCNNINQREFVIISAHPHNDRGTGVAAAELAVLAGADRVEGCLLGNGERTGNVDLITLALNLYTQGISPLLDFSQLPAIVEDVCRYNESAVPQRYPYAGALVFSAFAGTHQDAIKKGLDAQAKRWAAVDSTGEGSKTWAMPYIPLDPKDLGYGYENLIRVSSQSGKAGTAHVIKEAMGLDLPRKLQVITYRVIQTESERTGKEMTAALITNAFRVNFGITSKPDASRLHLHSYTLSPLSPSSTQPASPFSDYSDDLSILTPAKDYGCLIRFTGELFVEGKQREIWGDGEDAIAAVLDALREHLHLHLEPTEFISQSLTTDQDAPSSVSYLEVKDGEGAVKWGIGVSRDITASKIRAIVSAATGASAGKELPKPKKRYQKQSVPTLRGDSRLTDIRLRSGPGQELIATPDAELPMAFRAETPV